MSKPAPADPAPNRDFVQTILQRIAANTGLELGPVFDGSRSAAQTRQDVHELILNWVEQRISGVQPSAEWPHADPRINVREILFGAGAGVNVVPNVALTEQRFKQVSTLRGSEIDRYLRHVTNGLSLLNDRMTPEQAARTIAETTLASFGIAMIAGTFSALLGGAALLPALIAGVVAMGSMTLVVGAALAIVAEILLFFLVLNKKVFLGMVFNDTDHDFVVRDWRLGTTGHEAGDLFMNTGSMTSFMDTHSTPELDSPLVQVVARQSIAPGDPDNLVSAGIFCAEKKIGVYGTEGVMLLSSPKVPTLRFALLFACPYNLDNGVNVQIGPPQSPHSYFDRLYRGRGIERGTGGQGFEFFARVAAPRGGEACGFAVLRQIR